MTQTTLPIISEKDLFLSNLRSQNKYKRYSGLPLRYAGGKSLAVGHIIEHIPSDVKTLMSPFIGGASVEVACAKELNTNVSGYDIFDLLTNYWQVQISNAVPLADTLSQWNSNKETFDSIKSELRDIWHDSQHFISDIELAAMYWYNHNLSYGPEFLGWMSSNYESRKRYLRAVDTVRHFQCPNLRVDQGDFVDTIPAHINDFLYCDPPYYLDDGKMFRGLYPNGNFPVHHKYFNHQCLRDLLHSHKNGFVLSYNDCETIRDWYKDFTIVEVTWQYTLGQGDTRIGKNRIDSGSDHVKKSHELLIVKEN